MKKRVNIPRLSGLVIQRFENATRKVKGKPHSDINVANWLFWFWRCDLRKIHGEEFRDLQWEAVVFAYTPGPRNDLPLTSLPSRKDLLQMQEWVVTLWTRIKGKRFVPLPPMTISYLTAHEGKLVRVTPPVSVSWMAAFQARVGEILTSDEVARRVRFCSECDEPFLAEKRQSYCKAACSQKTRTRLYRKKHRDQLNAKRRAFYKKQQVDRRGGPIRIMTRKAEVLKS